MDFKIYLRKKEEEMEKKIKKLGEEEEEGAADAKAVKTSETGGTDTK